MRRGKKPFTFMLDPEVVVKLDVIAEKLGKSIDELVEAVLRQYVNRFEKTYGKIRA